MRKNTGKGRCNNLVRFGRNGDRWRNSDEEQQRCHQETATNAEHTGQNTNKAAQSEKDKGVHRYFGYGQIDVHDALYASYCRLCKRANAA